MQWDDGNNVAELWLAEAAVLNATTNRVNFLISVVVY
jgi:hypothetical protein